MDNNQKLLEVFLEDSYVEHHIRKLGRSVGLHPNTVISASDELVAAGLLRKYRDESTNRVIVSANLENPLFRMKKLYFNVRKIYESGLIGYLQQELSLPTIVLFGSHAKGENRVDSDIDLFVLCDRKEALQLMRFEKLLKKEIQLLMQTKKAFPRMKNREPQLVNNIVNGLVLEGFIEVV